MFQDKPGLAAIFNHDRGYGLCDLVRLAEPRLLHAVEDDGRQDYVMGLEPGNCTPDGRNVMRENGTLKFLAPGETKTYSVHVTLVENEAQWSALKQH